MADTGAASSVSAHPAVPADPHLAHAPNLTHAQSLIDQVNKHHDIQSAFIAAEKVDLKALEGWRKVFTAVSKFFESAGKLFAPLAPILPYVLFILALGLVALLLSPVVRMFISTRFERLFTRDHLKADAPWRPSKAAVTALLHDIDALAAAGQYDEAVHLLLVRSVADINAFRPDLVRLHYSARDICSHPLLPEGARPAFRQIVQWVEKSYFAGIAAGKEGFDACRKAYVDFIAAEGIA